MGIDNWFQKAPPPWGMDAIQWLEERSSRARRQSRMRSSNPRGNSLVPERDEALVPTDDKVQANDWGQQVLGVIREEMSRHRPMQFIINNSAYAQANVQQPDPEPVPPPPQQPETLLEAFFRFLASPLNRLCLFGVVGIGLYVLQGHLAHRWRLAEMKRRIDADLFMRLKTAVLR
ncbi:unnamed protein product [Effrenium voratum]|nr:unnamed protein product [Effrenium voratum]